MLYFNCGWAASILVRVIQRNSDFSWWKSPDSFVIRHIKISLRLMLLIEEQIDAHADNK